MSNGCPANVPRIQGEELLVLVLLVVARVRVRRGEAATMLTLYSRRRRGTHVQHGADDVIQLDGGGEGHVRILWAFPGRVWKRRVVESSRGQKVSYELGIPILLLLLLCLGLACWSAT